MWKNVSVQRVLAGEELTMESQTGSTVHTSGFGSPPPGGGGFGPPPGGGGGGFGPPPGAPPPGGGFGPPPGAPPPGGGFGPPPGGQPPGGFGAPMAPPPKKSNTMMFVGIGCLALLLLTCVCGAGGYWYVSMKAEEGMQALRDYQPPPGTYGTVPTTDPGGSGAVVAPGGDTCAKVDRCCPAFYVARGLPAEQAATTCSQMASARAMATGPMLETVCASQMQAFTSAGGGVPVPPECQ